VLEWSGGTAYIDTNSGKIVGVIQDRRSGAIQAPFLDNEQLASIARCLVSLMGWDDATLSREGFRPIESAIVSEGMCEYRRTWAAYTSQGIRTDGLIEVRLDAREGHVVSFFYAPGTGDVQIDTSAAISESEAETSARATVQSYLTGQAVTASDSPAPIDLTV
jgi:hypothetical protein